MELCSSWTEIPIFTVRLCVFRGLSVGEPGAPPCGFGAQHAVASQEAALILILNWLYPYLGWNQYHKTSVLQKN